MIKRGVEYVDDGIIARRLHEEQLKMAKKAELESSLSIILIQQLAAEENPEQDKEYINALNKQYETISKQLADLETTSTGKIKQELKAGGAQSNLATPRRVFTEPEIKAINAHYSKLPDNLRKLMDASIQDDHISLELIPNPVFIRGEGQVYDKAVLEKLLQGKQEADTPCNRNIKFKKSDIIPCNTLIASMECLLDIIKGKAIAAPPPEAKLTSLNKNVVRKRISAELIVAAELAYQKMEGKHKKLFDLICRDPITHEIMDNPVFLPDGYIYDHSTALSYLKMADGQTPSNQKLFFTEKDITPCYFVIKVLEQLKENILAAAKQPVVKPHSSLKLK